MSQASLPSWFTLYQQRIEQQLDARLPSNDTVPQRLHQAMRYASTGGGKRIRPLLVYATGHALQIPLQRLDAAATAVEFIHAYSLIHDDLPAMDDDDLRRGQPTCHIKFDHATAILAGDALQTLAFEVLSYSEQNILAENRIAMLRALAHASGSAGMAGGQAIDLAAVGQNITLAELETMHLAKTGALIRASVKMAALSMDGDNSLVINKLDNFSKNMGLAFQIRDDILDVEGETETLGKPQGSDTARNKPTYPSLLGLDAAKKLAKQCHQQAITSLTDIDGDIDQLIWLANYIILRKY